MLSKPSKCTLCVKEKCCIYIYVKKVWRKIYVIIQQQKQKLKRVCAFKRNKGIIPMWTHCVLWPVQELLYVPNINTDFWCVCRCMLVMWAVCVWESIYACVCMWVSVCVCKCMHVCACMGACTHMLCDMWVCACVNVCMRESNLVFYTQSTIMFISGQGKRETWCFTPSQPVWLYQGNRDRNIQINYI